MGRRSKLKFEEVFVSTILVIAIIANLCLKSPKKCYTLWEHDPKTDRTRPKPRRTAAHTSHRPRVRLAVLRIEENLASTCAAGATN